MQSSSLFSTPRLEVNLDKISFNTKYLVDKTKKARVEIVGITKGCAGNAVIANVMASTGIKIIGDSQNRNIRRLTKMGIGASFWLVRSPSLTNLSQEIQGADLSLNSDVSVIKSIYDWLSLSGINHKVILMIEIGDHREGLLPDDLSHFISKIEDFDSRSILVGVGATFGCLTLNYPRKEQIDLLINVSRQLEDRLSHPLEIVTLGGSCFIPLLVDQPELFQGITHLRIGEALLLGTDGIGHPISGLYQDAIELVAEVIETHYPPKISENNKTEIIVGIGYQDIEPTGITVIPASSAKTIGATSDHLILTYPDRAIAIGDQIRFRLSYKSMLKAFISPYVQKCYL